MIRIFIVDDHAIMRNGLRVVFSAEPSLLVVGEACHGQELLDQLPGTTTDVVLMDVNMPVLDGLATTRLLKEHHPAVRILILSMQHQEQRIGQLLEAGAHGYLLKSTDRREIVAAIHAIAAGRQYLSSEVGLLMLRKVLAENGVREPKTGSLSMREQKVLKLLAEGLTTAEIADRLLTTLRTVETHRQNIIEKTQVHTPAGLVRYAADNGLLAE